MEPGDIIAVFSGKRTLPTKGTITRRYDFEDTGTVEFDTREHPRRIVVTATARVRATKTRTGTARAAR